MDLNELNQTKSQPVTEDRRETKEILSLLDMSRPTVVEKPSLSAEINKRKAGLVKRGLMRIKWAFKKDKGLLFDKHLVTFTQPGSITSEQYRILYAKIKNLNRLREEKPLRAIAVTSAVPGEGKTITSVNLAVAMSEDSDKKILLIDGDLRKPDIHSFLKLRVRHGLADIVEDKVKLESALITTFRRKNLFILSAGNVSKNPLEFSRILNSPRIKDLIDNLREKFDYIICDSPPLLHIADFNIITGVVDGVILVIKASETPREVVLDALNSTTAKNIIGVVLNGVEKVRSKYYYDRYYDKHSW